MKFTNNKEKTIHFPLIIFLREETRQLYVVAIPWDFWSQIQAPILSIGQPENRLLSEGLKVQ
jgi:hypothetical protein